MTGGVRVLGSEEARFYGSQSAVSDPGEMVGWYEGLPRDVGELGRVVRDLMIHRVEGGLWDVPIADDRMNDDAETRYTDDILRLIVGRDPRPLGLRRAYGDRFVAICRDFTLLHVSLLRHLGIPARLRSGFATYFDTDGFHSDHVVTEYWDERRGWLLADAQLFDPERYAMDFDPVDVPRDRFLMAGTAWRMIRAGEADPRTFGLRPAGGPLTGEWFVAGNVRLDLAALNKAEPLLWDLWGPEPVTPEAMADAIPPAVGDLYDEAARISVDDVPFDAARAFFAASDDLRMPPTVLSYAPFNGPSMVTLR
jgi:hypothetical protein